MREIKSLGPTVGGNAGFKVPTHSYLKLIVLFVQRRCLGSLSLPSSMKSHTYTSALTVHTHTHTLSHTLALVYEAQLCP